MSEQPRVRVQIEDHVAEVILDRPDKHNGLDLAMFEGLIDAAERVAAASGVRAVVLFGNGPSFCAGLDFKSFIAGGPALRERLLERGPGQIANVAQRVGFAWTQLPMPVIAAIHGTCVGGGFQIALGADLRIAAPDARLGVLETEYGMIPDMSITQTLARLVRLDVAKELTFTGRVVEGPEALALGLVTQVAGDPITVARDLARRLAERSPDAMRAAKRLWNEAPRLAPAEALALETTLQLELLGTPNQLEAVQARFMKRKPVFKDPV